MFEEDINKALKNSINGEDSNYRELQDSLRELLYEVSFKTLNDVIEKMEVKLSTEQKSKMIKVLILEYDYDRL